jgi:hypothetical protein
MDTDKYLETIWEVKLNYHNRERSFTYSATVEVQRFSRADGDEYYSLFTTRRSWPSDLSDAPKGTYPSATVKRSSEYSWRQEALDLAWEQVKDLVNLLSSSSEEPR